MCCLERFVRAFKHVLSKFQLILNNFSDFKLSCKNSTFNGLKFKKNKLEIDKVLRERCYISLFLALFKYVFQKTIPVQNQLIPL